LWYSLSVVEVAACAEFKPAKSHGSTHEEVLRRGDMVTTGHVVVIGEEDEPLRGSIRDEIRGRGVGEILHRTGKLVLLDEDMEV
jgi:predicted RNase H-like HicB family nuclease